MNLIRLSLVFKQMFIVLVMFSTKVMKAQVAQPIDSNIGSTASFKVKVERSVSYRTRDGRTMYLVRYNYQFNNLDKIYIDGVGFLPSVDTLSYLTSENQINFRDSASGPILISVPTKETQQTMGSGTLDIPERKDFPPSFREDILKGNFSPRIIRIMSHNFPFGYERSEIDGRQEVITTYQPIPIGNRSLVKIAIRLVMPYNSDVGFKTFHLYFSALEKPSHDDWGPVFTDSARKAIQNYLNNLVTQLVSN